MTNTKFFHPAVPLLLGLLATQVIATIQVYLSNLNLHASLTIIQEAGYLAVPNQNVMPGLKEFSAALWGGLFFTLSIGAGLSLLSTAAAWVWNRLFSRNRPLFVFFILIWAGLLLSINMRGLSLFGTLYCLIIPPIVFRTTLQFIAKQHQSYNNRRYLFHLIPLVIVAALWFTQYDRYLFIDLRDHLLFSNPIGRKISDFYYTYTLNAAEAFKSLQQKMLKTCRLTQLSEKSLAQSLEQALLAQDYLPIDQDALVNLNIIQKGNHLLLEHHGRIIVKTTAKTFLSRPKNTLDQFSSGVDRFEFFRQMTFHSLLFGYPLTLYIMFHALFWFVIRWFADDQKAAIVASVLCLIISLWILAVFSYSRGPHIEKLELAQALNSDHWQTRVAALRFIEENRLEIERYNDYTEILTSSRIPERYWLAKAVAVSRKPQTQDVILELLNDSNVNVVCMAYWALSQRGDSRAIPKILQTIEDSHNWYSQFYAYRALRALGWKQSRSR